LKKLAIQLNIGLK